MASITLSQLNMQGARVIYKRENYVTVYQTSNLANPSQEYVVKELTFHDMNEAQDLMDEAFSMAKVSHPRFVSIEGIEFLRNSVFLIMPYFRDGDLGSLISQRSQTRRFWTESELAALFLQLLEAFAYLEEIKVAHRDIKPQNVLIRVNSDHSLELFVTDLGCATLYEEWNEQTLTVAGTPLYMSPILRKNYVMSSLGTGQFEDHDPFKSDVFSLGLTFLYMASFQVPRDMAQLEGLENRLRMKIEQLQYSDKIKALLRGMLAIPEAHRFTFTDALNSAKQWFEIGSQTDFFASPGRPRSVAEEPRPTFYSAENSPQSQKSLHLSPVRTNITPVPQTALPQTSQSLCCICSAKFADHKLPCEHVIWCYNCFISNLETLKQLVQDDKIRNTCPGCTAFLGM